MIVLRSASDATTHGLSWNFCQNGEEEYGIFGMDGKVLPVHYNESGEPDGWELDD